MDDGQTQNGDERKINNMWDGHISFLGERLNLKDPSSLKVCTT